MDFLPTEARSVAPGDNRENISDQDDCVLMDSTGLLNVFRTLTRANYNRVCELMNFNRHSFFSLLFQLKYEAKISLNSFNDSVIDHFQSLFVTPMSSLYSLDAVIE